MRWLPVAVMAPVLLIVAGTALAKDAVPEPKVAWDTVGGHLAIAVDGGFSVPFGSLQSGAPQSDVLGPGWIFGAEATYGVSRTVMLGVQGSYAQEPGKGTWTGDTGSSLAVGPVIRYHLVQGTRFDPWLSYGIGFRNTSIGSHSFTGLDWAHLQIGGDWYATSALGFGPFLDLALGTFLGSSDPLGSKAVNAHFAVGLRLVFDTPGK